MNFDPARLAIVDHNENCVLIRSTILASNGHIAWNELCQAAKMDLSPYTVIDYCLTDNVFERPNWSVEFTAFGYTQAQIDALFPTSKWPPYLFAQNWNPQTKYGTHFSTEGKQVPGNFIWWPIEGMPPTDDPKVFLHSPGWDFSGCVDYLSTLFKSPSKLAIVFHCQLGIDRTGALHAGYLMKNKKMTPDDALAEITKLGLDLPSPYYQRLVHQYAEQA